jgi:DNA modification methylase
VCTVAPELERHLVPIDKLLPDPANARAHPPRSIEAIAASLARFGQQRPVLRDSAGVVVAGNGVLLAARTLGWTHLAAVASPLSGVDRTAYAIADNRLAELSEWEKSTLAQLVAELPGDTLDAIGLGAADLEQLGLRTGDQLEEDETPEPAPVAVTRAGDLWQLGEHRLLCGDSTKAADVDRVLAGRAPALVSTDPPYVVNYTGDRPKDQGKDWSSTYREIEIKDAAAFFAAVFEQVARVMAPRAAVYCWHAHSRIEELQAAWRAAGLFPHQVIVWVKPTPVLGRCMFQFQHEPCLMGWKSKSMPPVAPRAESSVWTTAVVQGNRVAVDEGADVWPIDFDGKSRVVGNEHPTQKPIEIFARPMRKHTQPGALCFEPFSGSGSQLVAGEKMGRVVAAIELQPVFVDVAVRRWQTLTGRNAVLEGTDSTWRDVAGERGVQLDEQGKPVASEPRRGRRGRAPR